MLTIIGALFGAAFGGFVGLVFGGPSAAGVPPQKDRLQDAYAALGITADAKPAESMRPVAEERSRELYSRLRPDKEYTA